jgi:Tfp pilus assembly protein PilN
MKGKIEFNFSERWVENLTRETVGTSKLKAQFVAGGIFSLIILGIIGITPWVWNYKVSRDISQVEEKISSLSEITNQVSQLKTLKAEAEREQQTIKLIQQTTHDPDRILEKLKSTLPPGTVVNSFSIQDNNVTLSVSVPTPVDVARLWISLRDSGMFQEVDLQTISLQDKQQSLNFNLQLK